MPTDVRKHASWMTVALVAAGIYNLAWGAFIVLFPLVPFAWAGMTPPNYPEIFQCLGMVVGVYGVGYLLAARDPYRHWSIVLVGLMGKVFGPIGFAVSAANGTLPWVAGAMIVTNDLVWWIPFGGILLGAIKSSGKLTCSKMACSRESVESALEVARAASGQSLAELSRSTPLLVVFLRHAGCTFCREAVADVARQRSEIESAGAKLAFVHMSDPNCARNFFAKYGLEDVVQISDPGRRLYRAFGLPRAGLSQILGWRVWKRGFQSAFVEGHGLGKMAGDGLQMPGVFLVMNGRIVHSYRHQSASDRPDYARIASCNGADCSASKRAPKTGSVVFAAAGQSR